MPGAETAHSYDRLLEKVHSISRADSLLVAEEVKQEIEDLATSFGEASEPVAPSD